MELRIDAGDVALPASLDLPAGRPRGALAVLHGAAYGERSYFCYAHLARVLPPAGIAVLRYDRRPRVDDHDVPLPTQAHDAVAAIAVLRAHVGDAPTGLWGFSQGAWAAPLIAARRPDLISFLVLVSSCGVSPGAQMRFGTAEQLRRHGFGEGDVADLARVRTAMEEYVRGLTDRASAQAVVDQAADRPWFPLAWVPRQLAEKPGSWPDMDFDPAPVFARVTCPTLLFYGATDEWMPIDESIAAWRRAMAPQATALTVHRLAGSDHTPTLHGGEDEASINPHYTATMLAWLDARLPEA